MTTAQDGIATVGFIGLGDQGLPMAVAVAEAGFELHVWARTPSSLDALGGTPHVRHDTIADLAAACDVVGLCVSTDEDVLQIVSEGLLPALRPGSVVVNHGTGTPGHARDLTATCRAAGVDALDAPVSGGRPGAQARTLTTMVGGTEAVVERCRPIFDAFSSHVVHLGDAGSGQAAKLFNNAMMLMNQATIGELVGLSGEFGMDPVRLVEVLKLGSAASTALSLLNSMITAENVQHLSEVAVLDMELFDAAMGEAGLTSASGATARGLVGARGAPELIRRLNPDPHAEGPQAGARAA